VADHSFSRQGCPGYLVGESDTVDEMSSYANLLLEHYRAAWSTDVEKVPFAAGPIGDLPAGFGVVTCPPHGSRDMWGYATLCMSQPTDKEPIELHLFSRSRADHLVELLVAMAHYHRTGSRLGLGHTVNFGRSWLPQSNCDHGFISLPYLDGPRLEWTNIETTLVRFLWVIPVTADEVAYKRANGAQALEKRFEESHFDYADPLRPSVV
jgi:hypothetical protein